MGSTVSKQRSKRVQLGRPTFTPPGLPQLGVQPKNRGGPGHPRGHLRSHDRTELLPASICGVRSQAAALTRGRVLMLRL
eukprot:9797460-Alexandrium_andersonii.AAC.1